MQLTQTALDKINTSPELKKELVYHLANTSYTLDRWLRDNKPNGNLTTFRAIEIIKEQTGLKQSDIIQDIK
jgi:hypothetical protein